MKTTDDNRTNENMGASFQWGEETATVPTSSPETSLLDTIGREGEEAEAQVLAGPRLGSDL